MKKKNDPPEIHKVEEALPIYNTRSPFEPLDIKTSIEIARSGISKAFLISLATRLSMSLAEIASVIHVSDRTLIRYADDHKLDTDASSKVLQLQNLYSHGLRVFGTDERLSKWLRSEVKSLDDQKPIDFLDTPFGFDLLNNLLGRIEHGIFA